MAEVEYEEVFVVRIPTYGNPEIERGRLALRLGRALHHDVKPGCALAHTKPEHVDMAGLTWLTLDPKGDDMGHHPGHDQPLVPTSGGGMPCSVCLDSPCSCVRRWHG